MEKFLLLICLVAGLQAVTCQSPESCIHYSYPQQAISCLSFTNCSGAQCNITNPSGHASFMVHKCQDPVAVDLTVVTQNSNFHRQFNHSEVANISVYWSLVRVNMSRNATHLHFKAIADIEGDVVIIPDVVVPLNPRECMCQSMQSVIRDGDLSALVPTPYSCNSTTTCNGVHCQFSGYTSDITVDPCSEGVLFTLYNSDGSTVYQRLFNTSQNVSFTLPSDLAAFLGSTATLSVVLVHHTYSVEIEISVDVNATLVGPRTVQVLPRHTIILDKSNCSSSTTIPPPSTSSPNTPHSHNTTTLPPLTSSPNTPKPTSPTVSQTCLALRTLASSSTYCNTTNSCTMVECQMLGYHTVLTVLPCDTPPALGLVTRNAGGGVVFNRTLTQSQMIPIGGAVTLNVTVDHVNSETIVVEVDVITLGQSITLVPQTAIPIDRSHCPGYTPHPIPSHSYTSHPHTSPPIPTQTPLPTPPCPAMDNMMSFFRTHLSCEISATCDELNCTDTKKGSYVALMLLPCYTPPAFKMIFAGEGNFLWEHTFTHTEQVPYIRNITLNTTLNHISAGVIEVQVDATNMDSGGTVTYIPYTVVPLDISSCPPTSELPSTSEPVEHGGSQLTIAVVIPVSLGLFLVVVGVVVVTVVLVWRRCKRSGQYHFHRMRFSEVKTDAED